MEKTWTSKHNQELKLLSGMLFGNDTFVIFTDAEKNTTEFKRYEELVKLKQEALRRLENKTYANSYFRR